MIFSANNHNVYDFKMGIKGLKQYLRAKFPQTLAVFHLSHVFGKKVAIDILPYLYKYKAAMGDNWKNGMLSFLLAFLRYNVHPCVFTDGPCVVQEKDAEKEKRKSQRTKLEQKVKGITEDLEAYEQKQEVSDRIKNLPIDVGSQRNLLLGDDSPTIDVEMVQQYVEKLNKQLVNIKPEDMEDIKSLCAVLNIPFYIAKQEAESMCSYLVKTGQVDAVVTEDSDVLAYGSSYWISSVEYDGTCTRILLEDILREMKLTEAQFLDFCIMCGTDFNDTVPKMGPVGAHQGLLTHGCIETICEQKGITGEEWKTDVVRNIFHHPCSVAVSARRNWHVVHCEPVYQTKPDKDKVLDYLKEKKYHMNYAVYYFQYEDEKIIIE